MIDFLESLMAKLMIWPDRKLEALFTIRIASFLFIFHYIHDLHHISSTLPS